MAFCAKAWHLEHVLGRRPAPAAVKRRELGSQEHVRHGASVLAGVRRRFVGGAIALLLVACALGLFLLALAIMT